MKSFNFGAATVALVLTSAFPALSNAQTATANLPVGLTLTATCTITAAPMTFAPAGLLTANVDTTSDLSVTCGDTTPYVLALGAGTATGSTVAARLLQSADVDNPDLVAFNLYSDSARTIVWGETPEVDSVTGTGNGAVQAVPVYGRIPVQDTARPGTYAAEIVATVTF